MKEVYDLKLCAECGGKCCTSMPGIYSPDDFDTPISIGLLLSLFETGNYAIDSWVDEPDIYFVRPRIKGAPQLEESWGGPCIHHTSTGCNIDNEQRPKQCKVLIPSSDNCLAPPGGNKHDFAMLWKPYQKILEEFITIHL